MKKHFIDGKMFLFEHLLAVLSFCLFFSFPAKGVFQEMLSSIVFLGIFPLLVIQFVFKKSLREYGIAWMSEKWNFAILFFALFGSLGILYVACRVFSEIQNYRVPVGIAENFGFFIFYALIISVVSVLAYEVIFRGLIFRSWEKNFGYLAVMAQFFFFTLLLSATDGIRWQSFPILLSTLVSGGVRYYTKSLYFSFLFSWLFGIIGDVLIIYFFR